MQPKQNLVSRGCLIIVDKRNGIAIWFRFLVFSDIRGRDCSLLHCILKLQDSSEMHIQLLLFSVNKTTDNTFIPRIRVRIKALPIFLNMERSNFLSEPKGNRWTSGTWILETTLKNWQQIKLQETLNEKTKMTLFFKTHPINYNLIINSQQRKAHWTHNFSTTALTSYIH